MLLEVHANDMICIKKKKLPKLEKHWKMGKLVMDEENNQKIVSKEVVILIRVLIMEF